MKYKYLLLNRLILVSSTSYANGSRISGQVTDENREGLPGLNILIQGNAAEYHYIDNVTYFE